MLAARAALAPPSARAARRCSGLARAAGGDHGDLDGVGHGAGHRQVVAVLGAVGVHAGQDDLAGAEPLDLARPGDRLQPGRHPAAVDVDLPDLAAVAVDPLGVDVHDDALAAEPPGRPADELGVAHGGRVDRDLVGPGVQQGPDVVEVADAAADGQAA